ncbi:tyrosine-type recombinase/integrase [Sinorhizobium medicae]|nr:tyrosine-type recombinase/integrase [Sinorhizobium medicae]
MASEYFSGHTLTKVRNMMKKGVDGQVMYRDKDTSGLAIKITKTGASWYYSTNKHNFQIAPFSSFGLDDLGILRELVVALRKEASKGRDLRVMVEAFAAGHSVIDAGHLHAVEHGDGVTWEVARDYYLEWAALNKNKDTVRGYRSALGVNDGLRADFEPIHGKPVASITTADLARVRNNIIQRGRNGEAKGQGIRQANLTVAAIKACFTYIINNPDLGVSHNPARDLSKALERAKVVAGSEDKRALTQLEIGALWHALLSCRNETVRLILQLQLLTGQRRFTPTSAKKSAMQMGGVYDCVWSMEDKSHHWRKLPLPPLATSIVEQAMRLTREDSDYLFPKQRPRRTGDDMNGHINERTVSDKIEEMRQPGGIFEMMPWNVSTHDLRKTFTTIVKPKMSQFELAGRPMLPREIEMITHSNEGRESVSEKVYDRNVYLDTKMSILAWWEAYVVEGYRMYCESQHQTKKAA